MARVRGLLEQNIVNTDSNKIATQGPQVSTNFRPTPIQPAVTQRSNVADFSAPVLGGLQAAQSGGAGTDLQSSLVSGGVSTLAGAGSGALTGAAIGAAGGPIGAAGGAIIGGGVALLSSAVNSWLGIKAENKRKKEMEKFIAEVEAKNARKERQARQDSITQLKFNRSDIERQNAINGFQSKRQLLVDMINNNQNLKDRFIQTGVK